MRVYTSANDPLDFCAGCMPLTAEKAQEEFGNVGDGPDGRGNCFAYDAEHPSYSDDEHYVCHECGVQLTDED